MTYTHSTHPGGALEDVEDLLLGDGLVGGLRVGFGRRGEDGVDVGVDEGDELGVHGGGGLTELPVDPVLEDRRGTTIQDWLLGQLLI